MPSLESANIRRSIVRDSVPNVSIQQERQDWEAHAATLALPDGITSREELLAGVPCLWVEQDAATPRDPVLLYLHGGGLIAGSPRTHAAFGARLAMHFGRRVLLVDYRLAPEHPYPAALEDATAVYLALSSVTPLESLSVGAESSGAALGLALLLSLRDEGRPLPAAAFFISGHFDMTLSGESLATHCEVDPFTSRESLQRACDWYTSGADRHLPLVSPAFAALHALPPLLLQVGSDEMLLSDSLRVAERVRSHGGHVELRVWDGMWHNWPMYVDLPEADAAIAEAADFLERFATR